VPRGEVVKGRLEVESPDLWNDGIAANQGSKFAEESCAGGAGPLRLRVSGDERKAPHEAAR
jgi:hypothetical protein